MAASINASIHNIRRVDQAVTDQASGTSSARPAVSTPDTAGSAPCAKPPLNTSDSTTASGDTAAQEAAARTLQRAWRRYQADPLHVYLFVRPLSRGTCTKAVRNWATGDLPVHSSIIVSHGPGKKVVTIITGQENSEGKLAMSHPDSDVASRDKAAWESQPPGAVHKLMPPAFVPLAVLRACKQYKAIDSERGRAGLRPAYNGGLLVGAPSNCQSLVSSIVGDMAKQIAANRDKLAANLRDSSRVPPPLCEGDLALPDGSLLLGWDVTKSFEHPDE